MVNPAFAERQPLTAPERRRNHRRTHNLGVAAIFGLALLVGLLMVRTGPSLAYPALLVGVIVGLGMVLQPRYGFYLCVFLTLLGDGMLMPWYPFAKNLSSPESLLYINGALIFSPLEICLVATLLSWFGRQALTRELQFRPQRLFWPTMLFGLCVGLGLFYGLARGGDVRIALWEARPLLYLPVLVTLASHVLTRREHVTQLMWLIIAAIFAESVLGAYQFVVVMGMHLNGVGSITEHSAPVHMNVVFVLIACAWLFGGSRLQRWLLPLAAMPVVITYLAAQRRAAIAALVVGLGGLAVILFQAKPRLFWLMVPVVGLAGVLYVAAFWNNTGALGTPARAIKTILAPSSIDVRDQQSNAYRVIENINVQFTIRQSPLTGVGFGRKFSMPVPLPDISFFEWWEYITHNSVLWIWMKAGLLGFLALLYLIGSALVVGLRAFWRMPTGELRAITLTAVLFVVMHFVYAYVDMSWDTQSMVLLGAMLGLLNSIETIVGAPVAVPPKRWPWQADPAVAPGLL